MERMSQPRAVEEISNSPASRAPCLKRGNDRSLQPVRERFQPILMLEAFDGGLP
jgi:hypothetical protein